MFTMSSLPSNDISNTAESRTALRRRLLAKRRQANAIAEQALSNHLVMLLEQLTPRCIGLYWPIQGEFDVRPPILLWCQKKSSDEVTLALPRAEKKGMPLRFLRWQADTELMVDAYGIPSPADNIEVFPDLLLLPCVGFAHELDGRYYRLGYGAGCYDKTLAQRRVKCVGLAYEHARLSNFLPALHDAPLDYMVTEAGIFVGTT